MYNLKFQIFNVLI